MWIFVSLSLVCVSALHRVSIERLSLENYGNVQYTAQIGFGTPVQSMTIIFDTGSSDVWVPSLDCMECGTHTLFNASASSTYVNTSDVFEDQYGSGAAIGKVGQDRITIGPFAIDHVQFGLVEIEGSTLQLFLADGIMGLAFEGLASVTTTSVLGAMSKQNNNMSNMFAFFLSSTAYETGSELHIGGYDLSMVGPNASWHYTPVVQLPEFDSFTYWTIKLTHFGIVNRTENACHPFCYAIIDTGTSLIGIPSSLYHDVISLLTAGHTCEGLQCEESDDVIFPTIQLGTDPDGFFYLRPQDYVVCSMGLCELQLQNAGEQSWWILGDVFIKTYYTLFDAENMRIGIACPHDGTCIGQFSSSNRNIVDMFKWRHSALAGSAITAICIALYLLMSFKRKRTVPTPVLYDANTDNTHLLSSVRVSSYGEAQQNNPGLPSP